VRFTVFGAGAIGTLLAAKLAEAGHAVTVVARGARRQQVDSKGLVLRARRSGEIRVVRVTAHERLADAPEADFILVTVRAQQLDAAMEQLVASRGHVVTMVNTAAGYGAWRAKLGARLLAGFPGAICTLDAEGALTWELAPRLLQPTVVGEPEGTRSERVRELAAALRSAGLHVQVRTDMERWIRTHAGWMAPFMLTASSGADALRDPLVVRRWVRATLEGLRAVRASGRLAPFGYGLLLRVPAGLLTLVARLALAFASVRGQVAAAGANVAEEGRLLAAELIGTGTPALSELRLTRSASSPAAAEASRGTAS
jgi:2-dehydropantoate 2-reductase